MRLYTIEIDKKEYVAVLNQRGQLVTMDSLGIDIRDMKELIRTYSQVKESIARGLREETGHALAMEDCHILAPIPVPDQDVICLGVNYKEHVDETADVVDFTDQAATVYFSKRVNRATPPEGEIPFYDFVDSLDYEVELGVILGHDAYRVSSEKASDHIFGYTIINDVSARNVQLRHQQWYLGKSLDGYTPMGPCIVTADELKKVDDLTIECFVNGEKRQSSNTSLMITSVQEAIAELSQGMTLRAGTILATGTPGGVGMGMNPPGFLKEGDRVCCRIEGIGELKNLVSKHRA
ncbi:MAG: fumarylacetoacetate hydrolase family protein [Lachnospiraceae bacterium]|nr:fumarylacetoacetate hydrolase family protein [Lachnospiraceae bacterium]